MATDPDPAQGRPHGLYGNAFALATSDAVRRATKVLQPPTVSNIVAIEAPSHGNGCYSKDELIFILSTAIVGFAAAQSDQMLSTNRRDFSVVHTGYWGCGAYGGNKI